jgi:chloramphenicol 3-O phosphotransferase
VIPRLIFLNGTSSAGKTSVSKCLQELLLPKLYLAYSIDTILYALPPSMLTRMTSGADLSDLNYDSLVDSYYESARALLVSGCSLIMDDAVTGPGVAARIQDRFSEFGLLKVGLRCSLAELKRREILRGDRSPGEAEGQFPLVHQHLAYDLELDTTSTHPSANARKIVEFIRMLQPLP